MGWPNNEVTPRVRELIVLGMVIEKGKTYDEQTKRNVNLLEVVT